MYCVWIGGDGRFGVPDYVPFGVREVDVSAEFNDLPHWLLLTTDGGESTYVDIKPRINLRFFITS